CLRLSDKPLNPIGSRLSLLITTNTLPMATEMGHIHQLIQQAEQSSNALQVEKDRLIALLRTLDQNNDQRLAEKQALERVLSPLRRVPDEIVAEIMKVCLQPNAVMDRPARLSFLAFRKVCRQWRKVAYATPILWSGLYISHQDVLGSGVPFVDSSRFSFHAVGNAGYQPWKKLESISIPSGDARWSFLGTGWPIPQGPFDLHTPSLRQCHLIIKYPQHTNIGMVHRSLQCLEISVWCSQPVPHSDPERTTQHAICSGSAPTASQRTCFAIPNAYTGGDGEVISSFFRRSQCPLKRLYLPWTKLPTESLNRLLRSLPHPDVLEHLTLVTDCIINHLMLRIEGWSKDIEDPLFLPGLKTVITYFATVASRNTPADLSSPLHIEFYPAPWRSSFIVRPASEPPTGVLGELKDLGVTLRVEGFSGRACTLNGFKRQSFVFVIAIDAKRNPEKSEAVLSSMFVPALFFLLYSCQSGVAWASTWIRILAQCI
ncbi:hypothetical protein BKA70DRAFT_1350823, partial [Coprinopsis sp. MPI-PUGE-AT-0042]